MAPPLVNLDRFAFRQFDDAEYRGTKIPYEKEAFLNKVLEFITEAEDPKSLLVPGYADFCCHIFMKNFTEARVGAVKITDEVRPKVQFGYKARTELELPVLTTWVDAADVTAPVGEYLDLILYSKEQIAKENEGKEYDTPDQLGDPEAPWALISIKAQTVDYEIPMQPITQMRNTLGVAEGGSGVPFDRDSYMKSVNFWQDHVSLG